MPTQSRENGDEIPSVEERAVILVVLDGPDVAVAVGIGQRIADEARIGAGVEDQQIAAILVLGEGVVAGAIDLMSRVGDHHRHG